MGHPTLGIIPILCNAKMASKNFVKLNIENFYYVNKLYYRDDRDGRGWGLPFFALDNLEWRSFISFVTFGCSEEGLAWANERAGCPILARFSIETLCFKCRISTQSL